MQLSYCLLKSTTIFETHHSNISIKMSMDNNISNYNYRLRGLSDNE